RATAWTAPVWPARVWRTRPVASSQTLSVRSELAETARAPSGARATAETAPACPARVWSTRPEARTQILSGWAWLARTAQDAAAKPPPVRLTINALAALLSLLRRLDLSKRDQQEHRMSTSRTWSASEN